MRSENGILDGRQREGNSLLSPPDLLETVTAPGKPPGRVDKMAAAVLQLVYCVRLLGKTCDEGPLRTAILEAAARAEARARDAVFNPLKSRRSRGRRQLDDERAVARETRNGAEDDESAHVSVRGSLDAPQD